jgi:hypothetical protein
MQPQTIRRNFPEKGKGKKLSLCFINWALYHEDVIQEEIKRRLNSGNACYQSVQNILSSRPLSKIIKN